MELTPEITKECINEYMKTLPTVTIKCMGGPEIETKILWFFRESEGLKLLFDDKISSDPMILDESDYLSTKYAKILIDYLQTRNYELLKTTYTYSSGIKAGKEAGKELDSWVTCQILKFLEKYLITDVYDNLVSQIIEDGNYKYYVSNYCLLIKLILDFNELKLEKTDNILYKSLIQRARKCTENRDFRKEIKELESEYSMSTIMQMYNDIFSLDY